MGLLLIGAAKGCSGLVGFGLFFFAKVRQVEVQMEEFEMEAIDAVEIPAEKPPIRIVPAE